MLVISQILSYWRGMRPGQINHFVIFLICLITLFASDAKADRRVKVLDLGVTQFGVGEIEIHHRKLKLARRLGVKAKNLIAFLRDNPRKLRKLLRSKPVKVVIGPKGKLYLIDHHHWLRLLNHLEIDEVYYDLEPNSDFSDLNDQQFFEKLKSLELIYNFDEDKVELDPEGLVDRTIEQMENYNWRGLVGLIRDAGGFKKIDKPFFEFKWWVTATKNWILSHYGEPDFTTPEGIQLAVRHGLEFAASNEAQTLPGHFRPCDILLIKSRD